MVDQRADLWAFGVILLEMLSGRRQFTGETVTDTLAAVLRADIDRFLILAGRELCGAGPAHDDGRGSTPAEVGGAPAQRAFELR